MKNLYAIVAISENNVIGKNNKIPWRVPEDFRWFKTRTMGDTLLMGRKTFESIGSALSGRQTLILSHSDSKFLRGVEVVHDLDRAIQKATSDTVWICGGSEIYKKFLPNCERLYISRIPGEFEGDTFFPEYKNLFKKRRTIKWANTFDLEIWTKIDRYDKEFLLTK